MPFQKQVCFLFTGRFLVRTEKLLNSPFIRVPLFSFVVKLGKGPLDFADAQNTLTTAQSRQVHTVTQYGPFACQGTSFWAAAASGTATMTFGSALFCAEK